MSLAECRGCHRDRELNALSNLCTTCHNNGFSEEVLSPATLPTWQEAMEQADVDFHAEGGTE